MSTLVLERFEVLTAFFTTAACHCISDHFRHERLKVPPRALGARTEYFILCGSVSVPLRRTRARRVGLALLCPRQYVELNEPT